MQERRNSSALAMELRLSCTNPSICDIFSVHLHCEICYKRPYIERFGPGKVLENSLVLIHQNRGVPWNLYKSVFEQICTVWKFYGGKCQRSLRYGWALPAGIKSDVWLKHMVPCRPDTYFVLHMEALREMWLHRDELVWKRGNAIALTHWHLGDLKEILDK